MPFVLDQSPSYKWKVEVNVNKDGTVHTEVFNKSNLNKLCEVRGFATAVGFAFMESNQQIFEKN